MANHDNNDNKGDHGSGMSQDERRHAGDEDAHGTHKQGHDHEFHEEEALKNDREERNAAHDSNQDQADISVNQDD